MRGKVPRRSEPPKKCVSPHPREYEHHYGTARPTRLPIPSKTASVDATAELAIDKPTIKSTNLLFIGLCPTLPVILTAIRSQCHPLLGANPNQHGTGYFTAGVSTEPICHYAHQRADTNNRQVLFLHREYGRVFPLRYVPRARLFHRR